MIKDNIMKLTDGLFHNVFKEIAAEYSDIESNSEIILEVDKSIENVSRSRLLIPMSLLAN